MKHATYEALYKVHLGNIDADALLQAQDKETDPFYRHFINLVLGKGTMMVEWDTNPFTTNFRSAPPRQRLDETVFAFILRLVDIQKEERHIRVFRKPESYGAIMIWDSMLRRIILCVMALLYNVQWTSESIFEFLDPAVIMLLNGGDVKILRDLMKNLGVTPAQEAFYQAEREFGKLNGLHVGQYGSFNWRFFHWMAEAYNLRKGMDFYKKEWLNVLQSSLYRTLRCPLCMVHYRIIMDKLKPQLEDPNVDLAKTFHDIHNQVNALRREKNVKVKDYTESEYAQDREFMIQALSP